MGEELVLSGPLQDFEKIKKIDENGIEYWHARELMLHLGFLNAQAYLIDR